MRCEECRQEKKLLSTGRCVDCEFLRVEQELKDPVAKLLTELKA
jgi:hypothetical protein